jgi:hypothetical protein
MMTHWECKYSSNIPDLGNKCRSVVNCTHRPLDHYSTLTVSAQRIKGWVGYRADLDAVGKK